MSLWGYPDLPLLSIVVVITIIITAMVSDLYESAVLLEHYQVHELLQNLFKMQVLRLFHRKS